MSSWLTKLARRYQIGETVRFFVQGRKGTGAGIILTPDFQTGTVIGFDPVMRQYQIQTEQGMLNVNPRNIARA